MKRCPKCGKDFPDDANFCPVDAGRLEVQEEEEAGQDAAAEEAEESTLAGRFVLGDLLSDGRTGTLYRATDTSGDGRPCVVKLVKPDLLDSENERRIERELQQLERLEHDAVPRVLGHGRRRDGRLWVATELAAGRPADKVVAESGPLPLARATGIVVRVAKALLEAARLGVIHHDLAPKNLLIGEGDEVALLNFPLSVPAVGDEVRGVVEFVSPEQVAGKPVDQRSNMYSLGAIYYFFLTGRPPFQGERAQVLEAHSEATIPPATEQPQLGESTNTFLARALEKQPSKRFLTMAQFVTNLGAVVDQSGSASTQPLGRAGEQARAAEEEQKSANGKGSAAPAGSTMMGLGAIGGGASAEAPKAMSAAAMAAGGAVSVGGSVDSGDTKELSMASVPTDQTDSPASGKRGRRSSAPPPATSEEDDKNKFRETLWFKKGELDEAAAAEAAKSKGKVADKADSLPIEDRYADDGSLSDKDHERLSLKTGHTEASLPVIREEDERVAREDSVSEEELVGEMRGGRGVIIGVIVGGLAVVVGIVWWFI